MSENALFSLVLSVLTVAALLSVTAVVVGMVTRRCRPAVEHTCWVIVLLRLTTPPMLPLEVPGFPSFVQTRGEESVLASQSTDSPPAPPFTSSDRTNGGDSATFEAAARYPLLSNRGNTGSRESILAEDTARSATNPQVAQADPGDGRASSLPPGASLRSGDPKRLQGETALNSLGDRDSPVAAAAMSAQTSDPGGLAIPGQMSSMSPPTAESLSSELNGEILKSGDWLRVGGIVFGLVWIIGSMIVAIRQVRALRAFRRLMKFAKPVSEEITTMAERIAARLGLRRLPPLMSLDARISPLVWSGNGSPVIVLPAIMKNCRKAVPNDSVATGQSDVDVEKNRGRAEHDRELLRQAFSCGDDSMSMLIAHELAHVKRRDHWVRWLEVATSVLWWWCPLMFIARRRLRVAEEAACDAWVLRLWPNRASDYAQAIVNTLQLVGEQPLTVQLATGGLGSIREIETRLRDIHSHRATAQGGFVAAGLLVTLGALTCPLMLVGPPQKTNPQEKSVQVNEQSSLKVENDTNHHQSVVENTLDREGGTSLQPDQRRSADEESVSELDPGKLLPSSVNRDYAVVAPNEKLVAFIDNQMATGESSEQNGLFVYDVETKSMRLMVEKALKTRPAWSPDSSKIAIGNSPGYGNIYPLAIVDIASGTIDETGVQGAGAEWSPDGRFVAVSTQFNRAGSWVGGVPADGRIGIWDTVERRLSYVSPAGLNQSSDNRRLWIMSGGVVPTWSPDGEWLAWQQRTNGHGKDGERAAQRIDVWVSRRDGSQLKQAFEECHQIRWSADSKSLTNVVSSRTTIIADLPNGEAKWPKIPDELTQARAAESEANARGKSFDASQVLAANRLWQNPTLDGIDSFEFTHRMSPKRLDERFLWRRDGTTYIEVTHRGDETERFGTGWQLLNLSDASSFTFSRPDGFPRFRSPDQRLEKDNHRRREPLTPAEDLRRDTLEHLCGTRFRFPAIDWGRRTGDFRVADYHQNDGQHVIELRPTPDGYRAFELHAGAMFHTTAWAYMHDVSIDRSVLTIDDQYRIIREEDWLGEKRIAVVELSEWTTSSRGEQAPGRIRIQLTPAAGRPRKNTVENASTTPEFDFVCDQTFRVTPEGLWCLERGVSKFFDIDEAQQEMIVDLKFNAASDALSRRIETAQQKLAEMIPKSSESVSVAIQGLTPFELGATHTIRASSPLNRHYGNLRTICFMPFDSSKNMPDSWPAAALTAELRFASVSAASNGEEPSIHGNGNYLLALYDENRLPLCVNVIPEAAVSTNVPTVDVALPELFAQNRLWLSRKPEELPVVNYEFHLSGKAQTDGKDRIIQGSIPGQNRAMQRGITLWTALDGMSVQPHHYKVPIAYSATLNGRRVNVYGITGPTVTQEFGSGPSNEYVGGYSTNRSTNFVLVSDAVSHLPLVEQSEHLTFEFHEYIRVESGQFVPLRITCRSQSMTMDLRFQFIDGRFWLFDYKAGETHGVPAFITDLTIDGKLPVNVVKSQLPDDAPFSPLLDWTQFTSRQPLRNDDALTEIALTGTDPWKDSSWTSLSRLSREVHPSGVTILRHNLHTWPHLGIAKYWSFTLQASDSRMALICPETLAPDQSSSVAAIPLTEEQILAVPLVPNHEAAVPSTDTERWNLPRTTRVHRVTVSHEPDGMATLIPEVCSTSYYTGQHVRVVALLVDNNGLPMIGEVSSGEFRTYTEPTLNTLPAIEFLLSPASSDARLLIGCNAVITSRPMGSRWGMFGIDDPLFETADLLASRASVVRQLGLQQLYHEQWPDSSKYFSTERGGDPDYLRQLKPHRNTIKSILVRAAVPAAALDSSREPDTHRETELAIAIACRIAGFTDDEQFASLLSPLLLHESEIVNDSAAIGLGLLGDVSGLERLTKLAVQRPVASTSNRSFYATFRQEEIDWALRRLRDPVPASTTSEKH